jgi:hypothetical protein
MKTLKLPLVSYCGIEFNNRRWSSHLIKCEICHNKHNNLKLIEKNNWNEKCKCGCGNITNVGDEYLHGHWLSVNITDEMKRKNIIRLKTNNPLFKEENKKYGDDNPAKRDDVRKKISKNNPMHNIEYAEKAKENRKKAGYDNTIKILKNRWDDKELLEKRVKTYCKNLSEGKIKLKNNWKCGNYIRKNGNVEWFDSSYEEIRMKFFDENDIIWTKKHGIRIPYVNEKGLNTYYVPDFRIIENDKIIIEEVKGWIKKNDKLKAEVGIEYCKKNNYIYRFLLGEKLKYVEELSYNG